MKSFTSARKKKRVAPVESVCLHFASLHIVCLCAPYYSHLSRNIYLYSISSLLCITLYTIAGSMVADGKYVVPKGVAVEELKNYSGESTFSLPTCLGTWHFIYHKYIPLKCTRPLNERMFCVGASN